MEQSTRPKRPQRAMQPKNYKDPSSSESESEYSACTYKCVIWWPVSFCLNRIMKKNFNLLLIYLHFSRSKTTVLWKQTLLQIQTKKSRDVILYLCPLIISKYGTVYIPYHSIMTIQGMYISGLLFFSFNKHSCCHLLGCFMIFLWKTST